MGILVSVAFFTLFESKYLGYVNYRLGPSKVGFGGFLQPFSDAMKLFLKELGKGEFFVFYIFLLGPCFGIVLVGCLWGFVDS